MEDLWGVTAGLFQVWMFVVVFLIMLPAMFGLSLGVTGVYIQILVKILEVTLFNRLKSESLSFGELHFISVCSYSTGLESEVI